MADEASVRAGGSRAQPRPEPPADAAILDMLVLLPPDAETEFLVRELRRTRAGVRPLWPAPDPIPEADMVFVEIAPGLPALLPWVPGAPRSALVGVIPRAPLDLKLLRACVADAVLHRPFEAQAIAVSVVQAWSRFSYERRLRGRIDKLDQTLRSIRVVEQAKAILARLRNIGDDEAYRLIRQQAMERRQPVGAIAAAIVDSHRILG